MTKSPVPLRADDMTVFTRALARQLGEKSPSHLSLMNMIARAAGFQNVQHMRSASAAEKRLVRQKDNTFADARSVERTLHHFDEFGRLRQWPSKRSVQTLALWALWATLPASQILSEKAVNDHFSDEHLFEDAATLRRTMISCGLLTRKRDGTDYRRIEQKPPAEAKAVIRALSERRRARAHSDPAARHE
ncbi:DUF2087 domain-containing protein [Hoeflea sp.]|uniref:DUF2087 domain-containing protein n=1 Tax=Hoeflea sp. TaxID=1940281 RepID=UPI003B02535D